MPRRSLIERGQQQRRFVRMVSDRRPLLARAARTTHLPQALGLAPAQGRTRGWPVAAPLEAPEEEITHHQDEESQSVSGRMEQHLPRQRADAVVRETGSLSPADGETPPPLDVPRDLIRGTGAEELTSSDDSAALAAGKGSERGEEGGGEPDQSETRSATQASASGMRSGESIRTSDRHLPQAQQPEASIDATIARVPLDVPEIRRRDPAPQATPLAQPAQPVLSSELPRPEAVRDQSDAGAATGGAPEAPEPRKGHTGHAVVVTSEPRQPAASSQRVEPATEAAAALVGEPHVVPPEERTRRATISERGHMTAEERPIAPARPAPLIEPGHNPADDLFLPQDDLDRSPQAWASRLELAARREASGGQPPAEAASVPNPSIFEPPWSAPGAQSSTQGAVRILSPGLGERVTRGVSTAPTSDRTRRLLRPLVGVDPATVHVYKGDAADQVTSASRAAAITAGDDVAIAASQWGEGPAALGLLAHELTHVARQREPGFIPPVARRPRRFIPSVTDTRGAVWQAPEADPQQHFAPDVAAAELDSMDEEALAVRTETLVTRAAREQPDETRRARADDEAAGMPAPPSVGRWSREQWGNLPAPWEPLPAWLTSAPPAVQSGGPHGVPSAAAAGAPMTDAPVFQRASQSRPLDAETPPTSAPATSAPTRVAPTPDPDLDALARQVHAILRRRLTAERRRGS
jgi:Domain of unknown function (DUF4157)